MSDSRFDRQELLFGAEGQEILRDTKVLLIGVGGIGTQAIQGLAHLGVRNFVLNEPGQLKESSRNRYIGMRHSDPIPGTEKLSIAERLIKDIEPEALVRLIPEPFPGDEALESIQDVDVVLICVDRDGVRFKVNEACLKAKRRFIDMATEIHLAKEGDSGSYGGRVFVHWAPGAGCLVCNDLLDMEEVAEDLASPEERANREAIYGIPVNENGSGPSVVSLNGVVASLAITEFMVGMTGLRDPKTLLTYKAERGVVTVSTDQPRTPCLLCGLA